MSQSWQLLCACTDVAVITKQIFSSLKSLPAFHIVFRIATELYKACAMRKDSQCRYLIISTISGSVVMHCQDYKFMTGVTDLEWKYPAFPACPFSPPHLVLVLRVLLMFYNWTMQAQLQWLGRVGLGLWGTGDLLKH